MHLHLRIPPDPRHARTVRDALTGFAALQGLTEEDREALLFAVGEALANAIEHAQSRRDLEVSASADDERIVARVVDFGRGLPATPAERVALPGGLAERGRGIPIMQRCTDLFAVESVPGEGTTVTLERLRRDAATGSPTQETTVAS